MKRKLNGIKTFNFNIKTPFLLLVALMTPFLIVGQIKADFVVDTNKACGALTAKFKNLSTGNNLTYFWEFGNGNNSTSKDPTANYTSPNKYTVRLIVDDGSQKDTLTKVDYIEVFKNPISSFTVNPSSGCSPLPVNFTDQSTLGDAPIAEYIWDFSDGSDPDNNQNPTHEYQTGGSYIPSLQITDQNNCTDISTFNTIQVTAAPVAAISTSNSRTNCVAPYTVNFISNSSGSNLTYKWEFGDGGTSTQKDPSYTYNSLGKYTVSLIVSDPNCSDTLIIPDYVRLENSNASFTIPKKTFCLGEEIKFNNLSTGGNIYSWDFGDNSKSLEKNPKKVYQDSGKYVVRLVISVGNSCVSSTTDTVYIQEVIADFATDSTYSCNKDELIQFTNLSTNADSALWKFGTDALDESSRVYNPSYFQSTNRANARYTDSLIVWSVEGCRDTLVKVHNRTVQTIQTVIFLDQFGKTPSSDTIGGCLPISYNLSDSSWGAVPIVSWLWVFGNGDSSTSPTPSITYTGDSAHSLSVQVQNELGCVGGAGVIVLGGTPQDPTFVISTDSACQGDTVIITNTSHDTSKTDFMVLELIGNQGGGINLPSDSSSIFTSVFPDTGWLELSLTVFQNQCDSTWDSTRSIYINGPVILPSFAASGKCENRRSISFTGNMRGQTRFYWDFGDSTAIDSINENPTHVYAKAGRYFAILTAYNDTNVCGPQIDTLFIDIKDTIPLVVKADTIPCLNDSVKYGVNIPSNYASIKWYMNDSLVNNGPQLDTILKKRGFYPFTIKTIDFLSCKDSLTDTIFISRPIPKIGVKFIDQCKPFVVEFSDSSIRDTNIVAWKWVFNDDITSTQEKDTLTFTEDGIVKAFLKVTNSMGCTDSIKVNKLIELRSLNLSMSVTDNFICLGDSVVFNNFSSGLNPSYTWDFGDGNVIQTNNTRTSHTYQSPGTYYYSLTAEDANGCIISDTTRIPISVEAYPIADFTANPMQSDCYPLAVKFNDLSSPTVVDWEWDFGDNNKSILQNPFHNYTSAGKFDVILKVNTRNGCEAQIIKPEFIQTAGPTADFTVSKDTVCVGEAISFMVTNAMNFNTFSVDFGDGFSSTDLNSSHAYDTIGTLYPSLILSDTVKNCNVVLRDTIHIYDVKAKFSLSVNEGCKPLDVKFFNQSIGHKDLSWEFGNGSISDQEIDSTTYQQAAKYIVQLAITSEIGCKDTARRELIVHNIPKVTTTSDTGICQGDSVLLVANGGINYQWEPAKYLSNANGNQTIAFPDTTTTFKVKVRDLNSCEDSSEIEVFVQNLPNPFNVGDSSLIIGEEILIDYYAGIGFNYVWTPSEGLSCTNCPNPIAKPLKSTTYYLKAEDNFGCYILYDSMRIEVAEIFSLDVPNAFSPNGDGVNDIIYANGWGLKDLIAFKIYNRFGEVVFESTDFDQGWNGMYRNKPQNIETYVYTVKALTYSNQVITKKGNISLLR